MRDLLNDRQRQVLAALNEHQAEHGYPPSLRELGAMVGLYSPASVARHVTALETKGYIRRVPGQPRALQILPVPTDATRLP